MVRRQDLVFIFSLLILGTVGIAVDNTATFFISLTVFLIGSVHFIHEMDRNVFILAFLISFFTFLLGSEAIILLGLKENKYSFLDEVNYHTYTAILISLVFLFLSYVFTNAYLKKRNENITINTEPTPLLFSIRRVSLFTFYFLLIFKIVVSVSEVVFSRAFGYSGLYTDYYFQGPGIFIKLATMCTTAFFVYLGTFPSKKECRIPVILFLGVNVITIFSGRRNDLIVALLLILVYYCFRNVTYNNDEVWISKKQMVVMVLLAPLFLSGLYAISALRAGNQDNVVVTYFNGLIDFFYQQGFSINIIKWEKTLEQSIPDRFYSLGQIYEFFTTKNFLSKSLFDFESFSGQTAERALQGHRMSYLLSYLLFPWSYSQGYGVGSCYIAEAFHDFGYLGVAVFNTIYGFLFASFNNIIKQRKPFIIAVSLIMMQELLMAPRSYADAFIGTVLDFSNLEILLLIWIVSRYLYKRGGQVLKPM